MIWTRSSPVTLWRDITSILFFSNLNWLHVNQGLEMSLELARTLKSIHPDWISFKLIGDWQITCLRLFGDDVSLFNGCYTCQSWNLQCFNEHFWVRHLNALLDWKNSLFNPHESNWHLYKVLYTTKNLTKWHLKLWKFTDLLLETNELKLFSWTTV